MEQEMKDALREVALKYGELGAKLAINFAFDIVNEAVRTSETKIDDAFLPTLNSLKPIALTLADQISKENN